MIRLCPLLFYLIFLLVIPVSPLYGKAQAATNSGRSIVRVKARTPTGYTKEIDLYSGYYALVIACADYRNGWPKLPNPIRDAKEVKEALEELGFTVELVENPDSGELNRVLSSLPGGPGRDPQRGIFIFFAGHGHTLDNFDGTKIGYIVPVDAPDPEKDYAGFLEKAISMQKIEQISTLIKSKHVLMAFDSCFSGSIFRAAKGRPSPYIQEQVANPVRAFVTAGTENERVPDESVFKTVFIQGLTDRYADRNKDGYVTGEELGAYLEEEVINYTRGAQHPQFGKINNPKMDKGDFIFVLGDEKDGSGLVIETRPPGARVTINGVAKGLSPVAETGLVPGRVTVKVELNGYQPAEKMVLVREGMEVPVFFNLIINPTFGSLRVKSDPAGAEWFLDGAYAGTTPDFMPKVATGPHQVSIRAPGFIEWQSRAEVAPEEEMALEARLVAEKPSKGRLFVRTEPDDAQVQILNGDYGFQQGIELDPGRYHLEISAQGYDKQAPWVILKAGADNTLDVRLSPPDIKPAPGKKEPSLQKPSVGQQDRNGKIDQAGEIHGKASAGEPKKDDGWEKLAAFFSQTFNTKNSATRESEPPPTLHGQNPDIPRQEAAYASVDPKADRSRPVAKDHRYEKYQSGVIYDTETGLEWYVGSNTSTTWPQAKSWADSLQVAGGGWRMPTKSEVFGLYQAGAGYRNISSLFETSGWLVWAEDTKRQSSSVGFYSDSLDAATSTTNANPRIHSRAFAVRSRSDGG